VNFKRYQSIKKFETMEVENIELGKVYVFPKIDGSNASVWLDGDDIKCGSRNRELTLDNDNAGFCKYILEESDNIHQYLYANPTHRLFGEWLVPHTLKTYESDAWRKFYVFDVMIDDEYINYDTYKEWLDEYDIDYIPAICSITNSSPDRLFHQLGSNNFLIKDGEGVGEGVVIKNYDFVNQFGRNTFAKIVRADFKEKHSKLMGHPEINEVESVEVKIVKKFIDSNMVEKEYSKIVNNKGGWDSKFIMELFNRVYNALIDDSIWEILKEFKNPTINFRALKNFVIHEVKEYKRDLF